MKRSYVNLAAIARSHHRCWFELRWVIACLTPACLCLYWLSNGLVATTAADVTDAANRSIGFQRLVLTDKYYCDGVAAGDIDGDGDVDLVAGPYWYEGPQFKASHAFYEPIALPPAESPSNSMFSFVADFSGDGRQDILVLGRVHKHEAYWYENPGAVDGAWTKHLAFHRVQGESPMMVDLDGDGVMQVICHWDGCWGSIQPDPDQPTRPWRFIPIASAEEWAQFYHGQGVGDVNQDGRLDLILNDGWYEQPHPTAGTAASTPWPFHRGRFSSGRGGAQMFSQDVDDDGDQDILSAIDAHGWGLAWYEQLADPTSESNEQHRSPLFQEHLIMGDRATISEFGVAFTQPHAMATADINGDGILDVITGKRRWAHGPDGDIEPAAPPVVYWFELQREPDHSVRYIPHLIDDESGVGVQILASDLNADGLIDVATTSKLGTFVFLQIP